MILVKILYFVLASGLMAGVGVLILIPPMRHGDREGLYVRMIVSFAAKLLVGVGLLLLSWKVFGWSASACAFGMVGAYIIALLVILMTASSAVRALAANQQGVPGEEGEG